MTQGASAPLIPEVGIVALPYHQFKSRWMTPHHVLTRLAHYFHVLWMEPAHHWRQTRRQPRRKDDVTRLIAALPQTFDIYVPEPWLFDIMRPSWFRRWLFQERLRRAHSRLERRGCRSFVLHLWHYQFEAALDLAKYDLSLYHIDDEYSFTSNPPPMPPGERRVIERVDHVFAISPGLMDRKGGINPHMSFAPEGVDYSLYSTPVSEPPDLAKIPHPRVGYTGVLKMQLNWPLLRDLATRHAELSFVFVGPRAVTGDLGAVLDDMGRCKNVYFLGPKTVRDLAAYPQHFDVCIMPYLVDGYTDNIYPLKLHEYLASGTPVVGSPVRTLKEFDGVIALARTIDDWSTALIAALRLPAISATHAVSARQVIARRYDWSEITYDIARMICDRLGHRYAERIRKLPVKTPVLPP